MSKNTAAEAIKVVVRVRPLSAREQSDGHKVVTTADEDAGTIEINNPSTSEAKRFTFDNVFMPSSSQQRIYDVCAAPVVQSVLDGYNGTLLAYGQTGAGKTFTMQGQDEPSEVRGIIPRAFQHVFDHVAVSTANDKYLVRASYYEIYNEEIRDLLSSDSSKMLELKEAPDTGVYVKDLTSKICKSVNEISAVLESGHKNRSVGATLMNQVSSRSHAVFTVVIECCTVDDSGAEHIRVGKLFLVDLAGSERQSKTGATGLRLKEATKINLSLSALGNVISALVDGKSQHIPYRHSKLTRILQASLGGNTRTVMCANVGPADYNYGETLSTLRYANRAKNIKNKPVINEDPKDAMLREYQDEISALRQQLSGMHVAGGIGDSSNGGHALDVSFNQSREVEEERDALKARLDAEAKARADMEKQRKALQQQLEDMEQKVMVGGEIADQAAKQEAALRKAEQEIIARREKELLLAREVEAKEELNLNLEDQYSSLSDEVAHKTKKLKKLYQKYKEAKGEISDLQSEFQAERNDLLQTIRDLDSQLKLKDIMVEQFIPPRYSQQMADEAVWDEDTEEWLLPELKAPSLPDVTGRRMNDDNVLQLDLDLPGPSSRMQIGDGYSPHVQRLLNMAVNGKPKKNKLGDPYQRISDKKSSSKRSKGTKATSRPSTAL